MKYKNTKSDLDYSEKFKLQDKSKKNQQEKFFSKCAHIFSQSNVMKDVESDGK